jgi:UDP-N-acetylglucosamine 2-epimerase (non-hydrolysing)
MIDTLHQNLNRISCSEFWERIRIWKLYHFDLHRPSNVDEEKSLVDLLEGI